MKPDLGAPEGKVAVDGERATITFHCRYPYPLETVWHAITNPEQLSSWYMAQAAIDGRPGGIVDFRMGPGQLHVTGRIREWKPPHVFEYEWKVKPWQGMPNGEDAVVRWELRRDGEGTLLVLTHSNLTKRSALGAAPSMHVVLERLAAQLAGLAFPDFRKRVADVQGYYPSREEAR